MVIRDTLIYSAYVHNNIGKILLPGKDLNWILEWSGMNYLITSQLNVLHFSL